MYKVCIMCALEMNMFMYRIADRKYQDVSFYFGLTFTGFRSVTVKFVVRTVVQEHLISEPFWLWYDAACRQDP